VSVHRLLKESVGVQHAVAQVNLTRLRYVRGNAVHRRVGEGLTECCCGR
jgi:hypothetical protein